MGEFTTDTIRDEDYWRKRDEEELLKTIKENLLQGSEGFLMKVNFTGPRSGLPEGAAFALHVYHLKGERVQQLAIDFLNKVHQEDCEEKIRLGRVPTYGVYFDDFGTHKIDCIKVIRAYFDYGLKEAKDVSEKGPNAFVAREPRKDHAEAFVKAILNVGGAAHITEEIINVD